MTLRLTNDIRETIARRAAAATFDPRKAALDSAEDVLGRAAHAYVFPKAETDIVAALPAGWVRNDNCLRFNVGGETITLHLAGDGLPVPYRVRGSSGYSCHNNLGSIEHGDLCTRIQLHARAVEAHKTESKLAYSQTLRTLATISTVKKLREAWPQGEAFYSMFEGAAPANLPAVRFDEINAALGLAA